MLYRFSHTYIIISVDPPIHVIIPGIIVPFVPFGALVILIILAYKKCKRRNYTCTKESKLLKYNSVNKLLLVGDIHRHPSVESGTVHVHVSLKKIKAVCHSLFRVTNPTPPPPLSE